MSMGKGLDRIAFGLAALVMIPGFFVGGIMYARLFQDATPLGVCVAASISAGICFPPALILIRGIFRLVLALTEGA
jgi:hypothetical protein